jgi:hypothetical protein
MPKKPKSGSSVEEPEPVEEPEAPAVTTIQPTDTSVLKQMVEKEMKMTMDEYLAFKSSTVEWGKETHPTNGMKVGQIVSNEVSWRLNTDRRDRAANGDIEATHPTQNYLGLLMWMSNVKNKWVATPHAIPKLQ